MIDGLRALREPGLPDPLGELVELFLSNAPELIAAMGAALESRDLIRLGHEAHSLKGSASNLGALRMTRLCGTIMSEVRNPTGLALAELVAEVSAELPVLKEQLTVEVGV